MTTDVRFLNDERSRAEVTVEYSPSWFMWLLGLRGYRRKAIVVVGYTKGPSPVSCWAFEADMIRVDPRLDAMLDFLRRWEVVGDLPSAKART